MKDLIVHEDADAEILHEARYYEERAGGLGYNFLSAVETTYRQIQDTPGRWQKSRHRTRRITLDRFSYTIYYRELVLSIWIIAVAPQSRRPFYWQYRLLEPPQKETTG